MVKLNFFTFLCFLLLSLASLSQGLSVSYLIPQNGQLAAPVSPFSVRGLRLPLLNNMGIQTGGTLYIFPGLPVEGLPFSSEESLRGASLGLILPVEAYVGFKSNGVQVLFSGGVFGIGFFNNRINQGHWDRAIRDFNEWDLVNGELQLDNRLGYGWISGISIDIPITRKYALSFGVNYLSAQVNSPIGGIIEGITSSNQRINETLDYNDAYTLLQGLEISLGVSL